jgi:hypothetical protein
LQGETGNVGNDGARGQQGVRGNQGDRGFSGADSTVPGPTGADSTVPGPKGDTGETGTFAKFSVLVGDGTAQEFTITHNFNSQEIILLTFSDEDQAPKVANVTYPTLDTALIEFDRPPAANSIKVVVYLWAFGNSFGPFALWALSLEEQFNGLQGLQNRLAFCTTFQADTKARLVSPPPLSSLQPSCWQPLMTS